MSKAATKLRKLEGQAYREWFAAVRAVSERRNALILAANGDQPEAKSLLTMAIAYADRKFNAWGSVCDALDELEQASLNGERRE